MVAPKFVIISFLPCLLKKVKDPDLVSFCTTRENVGICVVLVANPTVVCYEQVAWITHQSTSSDLELSAESFIFVMSYSS